MYPCVNFQCSTLQIYLCQSRIIFFHAQKTTPRAHDGAPSLRSGGAAARAPNGVVNHVLQRQPQQSSTQRARAPPRPRAHHFVSTRREQASYAPYAQHASRSHGPGFARAAPPRDAERTLSDGPIVPDVVALGAVGRAARRRARRSGGPVRDKKPHVKRSVTLPRASVHLKCLPTA